MQKIPTLFIRDEATNRQYVRDEITPGCEWVLKGLGRPTYKWDGTCVLIRRDRMAVHGFARREVKPGKDAPPNFIELGTDEITGKRMGWEPIAQSGWHKFYLEALGVAEDLTPGTYELVGPKINGNPEGLEIHDLKPHGLREINLTDIPLTFEGLKGWLAGFKGEGIVWWGPNGERAKLKKKDFPHG